MRSKGIDIEIIKVLFVALTIIISIDIWSFQSIPDIVVRIIEVLILLSFIAIISFRSIVLKKKLIYTRNVWLFILFPLISVFGAAIYHDQSPLLSLTVSRVVLFWLFYFVLHILNPKPEHVVKVMIFVGLVWGLITVLQQFTYPTYYFYNRQDSEDGYYSIYRAGVYRFMIYGYHYGVFLLLYFFYKALSSDKAKPYLFLLLGLISIYYYGTRQIIIAAGICMMMAFFFTKGRAQRRAFAFVSAAAVFLIFTADYFIQQYVELTKEQWQYGEDQRQITAEFFLFRYWPHWTAMLIGNGPDHEASAYGQEIQAYQSLHIYRVDVGIFGAFNAFGIFHVLNILWANIKSLKKSYYTTENKYLLLVVLFLIILLPTSEFYMSKAGIPFYCLVFYLIDKSRSEKDKNAAQVTTVTQTENLQIEAVA